MRETSTAARSSDEGKGGHTSPSSGSRATASMPPAFADVYDEHFDFVWRTARRLGVAEAAVDDVVQETFIVVHRRLDEPRTSSLRTFIYGVVANTVRNHRRSLRRKPGADGEVDPDALEDASGRGPEAMAERAQAGRMLEAVLRELDDEQREVFVLVELEQLSASEVAQVIDVNVNTVKSRLRLAREAFEAALRRLSARSRARPDSARSRAPAEGLARQRGGKQ